MTQRKTTLLAAVVMVLAALCGPGRAAASSSQAVFFEAPSDLTARTATAETRAAAFQKLHALGVRALRVNLPWHDVAPAADEPIAPPFDATNPAAYFWGSFGATIDTAKAKGWTVLISLSSPVPKWATQARADYVTRPVASEYQRFATAAARRFGGEKVMWSIWNEPNLPRFLMPQVSGGKTVSPRLYRELFEAGRAGIRAGGQSRARVLFGELAPVGGARDGRVYPLTFLRSAFCLSSKYKFDRDCKKLQLDGVAHHPYQFTHGKLSRNDVTYRVMDRLTSFLDRAGKAKAISKKVPVYYTEFGIQSYPDKVLGVSPQRQYEIRARVEREAYGNKRVRGFSQYLMTDDVDTGGFQTGLLYATGKTKPAFDAFRLTLDARPVRSGKRMRVSLWGLVRPADKRTTVVIERRTGKKFKTWKKVRTNKHGAFTATDTTYRAKNQYRYRWTSPDDGKLTSPPVRIYKG